MFRENKILEKILNFGRKIIPGWLFRTGQPIYHWLLAWLGALLYGFPSRSMKVIGVTGTKGKSTTVFLIAKILEEANEPVAMIGSLGYKIREKEWPNNLKMTMPGRFKMQKFFKEAKDAGCKYVVLEVTSEGIKQKRHLGIKFDTAVLTNIQKEHIESHGSFENYIASKEQLFRKTKQTHILNQDEPFLERFKKIRSTQKIFYSRGDWQNLNLETTLVGDFNKYNILAAATIAGHYQIDKNIIKQAVEKIKSIPGRMEFIEVGQPFRVVIDYAHTPESLEMVYKTLKHRTYNIKPKENKNNQEEVRSYKLQVSRLICVLGAAGGGRDKWKRPEFGRIAARYCDEIILTDEDPYDENPEEIINQIKNGFSQLETRSYKLETILDRKKAIKKALMTAKEGDTVVITGKGSEISMALAEGKKIPWSDKEITLRILKGEL